jgi:Tol biopolymer transport system component
MVRLARQIVLIFGLLGIVAATGSAQEFGQNKVQYKDFKWSVIETEHFRVYFYEGERAAAVDAARMAERAYERLSAILQHNIEEKVPLVLYASHTDFQSSNITTDLLPEGTGGLTEYLKRRVMLPFTGGYGDLDHVLTHELVHAFQIDVLFGKGRGLSNPFGTYSPPTWFMEGMAEYLSVTRVDNLTQMWLRDGALQGYLIPLDILSQVYDIRNYRFGQSIFAYIGQRFGDDRIGELLRRTARSRNVEKSFQDVLGITLEKFSKDWMEDVRKTYLPQIRDHKKPEDVARRLTDSEKSLSSYYLAPAIAPTGDRMVFLSDRSLYNDLYIASALDGKVERRLVKGDRREQFESLRFLNASFDFSPDGQQLVFAAKSGGGDAIYVMRTDDGTLLRRLAFALDGIANPSFSPDGEQIVFVGLQGGRSDLYLVQSDGTNLRRLTDDRYMDFSPRFAPDGRAVVFVTDEGGETDFENLIFADPRLAILDLESGKVRVLPEMPGTNTGPHFFPDGKRILYVSDRTGIANLYIRDLETGRDAQITDLLTGVTGIIPLAPAVSLSRDGRRLVFSAFSGGAWDLFAIKDPLTLAQFSDSLPGVAEAAPIDAAPAPAAQSLAAQSPQAPADSSGRGAGSADSLGTVRVEWPEEGTVAGRPDSTRAGGEMSAEAAPSITDVFAMHRGLPDTTAFKIDGYKVRFSADYAAANGAFASNVGIAAQTYVQFSDVLGDHNLVVGADIYGTLSDSQLLLEYANLANRINYSVAAFQYRDDFFLSTARTSDEFHSQIYRGGQATLSRPFSRFRRLDFTLEGLEVSETVYRQAYYGPDYYIYRREEQRYLHFVRPGLALIGDNTVYGITGPISGGRNYLSVDVAFGDLRNTRWILDRRNYWNIRQRYAFALRTVGATSNGNDPNIFRIGGPFTIRGYDYGELSGRNVGLVNLEFRFPLIETLQLGWPLPLGLRGIRGALFFDAASAWRDTGQFRAFRRVNGGVRLEDIRASYGINASWNIGFAILRWDLAWPTDLRKNLGEPQGVFTIGSSF